MNSKLSAVIDLDGESAIGTCPGARVNVGSSAQMIQKSTAWELSRKPVR